MKTRFGSVIVRGLLSLPLVVSLISLPAAGKLR
jgi:hypothetical protein